MKIYRVSLELYVPDSVESPDKWQWDNIIKNFNIKDLDGLMIGFETLHGVEDTIPTKDYGDSTEPPVSEHPVSEPPTSEL